jgi:GNAT superfamily N-acetyltransferase
VNDNFLDAYADTARRMGTVIYGAFIGSEMYASAELRSLHPLGDEMAEAAFVVESAHRHHGLGSALMDRIITAAKNRGIHQLHMICARDNQPMQRLGEKFGAQFTIDHGEALGEIETEPATPLSLLDEAMHDTTDFVTAVLDWSVSGGAPPRAPRRSPHHRG